MEEVNLFIICVNAFIAVLILLSVLGFGMLLLTHLFPVPVSRKDTVITTAINTAVTAAFPGARLTRVEEIKE
jgi:hypothetical protein